MLRDAPIPRDALRERVVLVTGAGSGFGQAVALAAAAVGAELLLLGRDVRALEDTADSIESAGGRVPALVPLDLEGATRSDYEQIGDAIAKDYGRLDGLVLNAAMLGDLTPLADYDPLTWARVFQVNVHSTLLLLQACLPHLRAAPRASVVMVSSSVGRRARAYWGAYAASKFALEGMMQTLADELADDTRVRVNSLNPGRMRTRMRAHAYPAEDAASLPLPAAIAPACVYLLSDASAELHGQALNAQ